MGAPSFDVVVDRCRTQSYCAWIQEKAIEQRMLSGSCFIMHCSACRYSQHRDAGHNNELILASAFRRPFVEQKFLQHIPAPSRYQGFRRRAAATGTGTKIEKLKIFNDISPFLDIYLARLT